MEGKEGKLDPDYFEQKKKVLDKNIIDQKAAEDGDSANAEKGTGPKDTPTHSEKVFNEEINREFKLAQETAKDGDYETAIKMAEKILESPIPAVYSLRIKSIKDTWEKQKKAHESVDVLWEKHKLEEVDSTEFEKRFRTAASDIHKNKQLDDEVKKHMKSFMRDRGNEVKKEKKGFGGYLTIADNISNIVDEARELGDVSKGDVFDQSKLERAIARLKQARQLCLEDVNESYDSTENPPKQEFWNQFIEVNALIDRYETDYKRAFELFNLSEKPGDPFALKKLKISMDDQEVKQDHFDTLAAKVANFTHTKDKTDLKHFLGKMGTKYKKDKGASNVLNHFNQYEQFEDCVQLSQEGDLSHARMALEELKKSCKNKEIAKIVDKSIKAVESGKPIPEAYLDDFLSEFVKDSTAESERARRTGEMMKEEKYGVRHIKKRDNSSDLYAGRALSGHEHWGEGGHVAVDALEWIGFDRNPIETIGNLAATYLAFRIIVYGIVGPILDTFSFFIPFIGILKIPIYIIGIIILHPFMKTILHPIKRDLHFLAGDPYWYKEGTSLHTARKIASDKEERREWVGRRKEQYQGAKEWGGRRKDQLGAGVQRGKGRLDEYQRKRKEDKEAKEMENEKRKEEAAEDLAGSA